MASLSSAEKGHGSLPRRLTSMQVADTVQEPEKYTLTRRPWRPRTTPFPILLRQEYRGDGSKEKPFIITWLPEDPENPQTYSNTYKWTVTMIAAVVTLAVALASSAYSGAVSSIRTDFNVKSEEVIILGVSLFVLGFALGPLIWAPLSEVFGRRPVLVFSYVMFTIWNAVAAASPNMGALIVFRFLAGAFGSSPLANSGGTISDMFSANMRGLATALFAAAPFLGPALGPITGGFLGESAGWRWVQGFLGIFTGILTVVAFLFVPETYAPALLRKRAAHLSKVTGKYYRAPMDAEKELNIKRVFLTQLSMPWVLLFQEPIVMVISIYMAIIYGTLYMLFAAYPIVFQQTRGWSPGIGGLAFLGLLVGMMIGVAWTIFITNPRYIKTAKANGGRAPPEERLQPSLLGAPLLIIGLAWFAATCGPEIHWIVPILSGVPFGLAMLLLFLSLMNYLVDVYTIFAASVLAGNSVLRSLFGAAFPLFTTPMYRNLGIHWASAVPGFLALACLPFPYLFYKYGASVRAKCKWTVKAETMLAAMMAGGQAAQKKEAPASGPSAEEENEDAEAALDAPVEEDVVLRVDERDGAMNKRTRQNSHSTGQADDVSQQDTLAEEESQRHGDAAIKK